MLIRIALLFLFTMAPVFAGEEPRQIKNKLIGSFMKPEIVGSRALIKIIVANDDPSLVKHLASWTESKYPDKALTLSPGKLEWIADGKVVLETEIFLPGAVVLDPGDSKDLAFLTKIPEADGDYTLRVFIPRNDAVWGVRLTVGFEAQAKAEVRRKDGQIQLTLSKLDPMPSK